MDWSWLLWQVVFAFLLSFFATRRSRSAMQRYANDLRRAAQELSVQSQQLTVVEEAAKESTKQSTRRTKELQTLRDNVASLSATVDSLTDERDAAREKMAFLRVRLDDLSTKLARSDARRDILEKEIAAARLVKLELLSKLRIDETERLSALNSLRHPAATRASLVLQGSPGPHSISSETALSPMAVAKSPSESMLLALHPDLDISDDDEDEFNFRQAERTGRELEANMVRKFPMADRLRPDGSTVGVRRKLDLPDVKLGKPALTVEVDGTEGIEDGSSSTKGKSSYENNAAVNRDSELPQVSSDDHLDNSLMKDDSTLQAKKADVDSSMDSNVWAVPNSVDLYSVQEPVPLVERQTPPEVYHARSEPGSAANGRDDMKERSSEREMFNAGSSVEERSPVGAYHAKRTVLSGQSLVDDVPPASAIDPTIDENMQQLGCNRSPTEVAHFPLSAKGAANELPDEIVEPKNIGESSTGLEVGLEFSETVPLSISAPPSAVFTEFDEVSAPTNAIDHREQGQNRETSLDLDSQRRRCSRDLDREMLSLNRAPWIDTLNPKLQNSDEGMSIASILQPAITQTSSCIVPVSTRTRSGTLFDSTVPSDTQGSG